jgi:type I restriction enzyme S subunit
MNLETFLAKFDQFADAPDAVAKMRELVLQLAVTGKLVAQDKRDEPASSLLESTEAERAKLIAAKKIKSRPTSPVEPDEQPFELPSSWAWARLSDVGYELGQKVPDKRFTYIDVGGIDSDKGRISDRVEKLEPGDAPSRARKLVARGTVIYSTVRPYLLNIAIVDQDFDPEPIASTAFGILHPFEGVNNRYLFYWLRSAPFTAYVQAGMKGMAYPAINDEKFYSGYIALPPLAEQKRIVAKVDELMALCDRLEAQQQERETRHAALARASLARFADAPTPANLPFLFHPSYAIPPADLRKSILTLAVQGKLVPQDPNDEPAEDSLARNDERRRETARSDHRPDEENQPLLSGDDRWDIAETWAWRGLADLVLFVDYRGKTPAKLSSGVRLLTAKNVRKGQINLSPEEFLSESEYHAWMTRGFPKAGDVLFTTEAPMGNAAVVELTERFALAQRVICFQSYGALDSAFLVLQILSDQFQFILDKNGTGVTAKGIKASKLKQLPIAVPPLAEQRRIVAKVEQLMALVDVLETQLAASRATAANLLSALVAELTVGEGPFSHRPVRPPPARPGLPGVVK